MYDAGGIRGEIISTNVLTSEWENIQVADYLKRDIQGVIRYISSSMPIHELEQEEVEEFFQKFF